MLRTAHNVVPGPVRYTPLLDVTKLNYANGLPVIERGQYFVVPVPARDGKSLTVKVEREFSRGTPPAAEEIASGAPGIIIHDRDEWVHVPTDGEHVIVLGDNGKPVSEWAEERPKPGRGQAAAWAAEYRRLVAEERSEFRGLVKFLEGTRNWRYPFPLRSVTVQELRETMTPVSVASELFLDGAFGFMRVKGDVSQALGLRGVIQFAGANGQPREIQNPVLLKGPDGQFRYYSFQDFRNVFMKKDQDGDITFKPDNLLTEKDVPWADYLQG